MLNKSGDRGHPCLVHLKGKSPSFLLLSITLAVSSFSFFKFLGYPIVCPNSYLPPQAAMVFSNCLWLFLKNAS